MRHRFHALCPYFAMFPETFAETWLDRLTRPGDVVLDPFCGRGTLPFQALLMGRRGVGCDVNPVAYCVTRAKTNAPALGLVDRRLDNLEREYRARRYERARLELPTFFRWTYRPETLRQVLYLRERLRWSDSNVDAMIAALGLGALHGETNKSPCYLSNQMPHTISTKPAYSVRFWKKRGYRPPRRDVFDLLRGRARYRYETPPPDTRGFALLADMRKLPRLAAQIPSPVQCVITSPPYLNVTNFEEDQWLRLWFLGGPPRPTYRRVSKDDRHEGRDGYWRFIADMWRSIGRILADRAHVVIRLGAVREPPERLLEMLVGTALASGRRTRLAHHEVSELRRRQTRSFQPSSGGCKVEIDCHFVVR